MTTMQRCCRILILLGVAATQAAFAQERNTATYLVKIFDLPEMKVVAARLRSEGVVVDIRHDTDAKASNKTEDYPVVWVGRRVPVAVALPILKRAREFMPWFRYVFVQDDPEFDTVIGLSAHIDWVAAKQLHPLSDADFLAITRAGQSDDAFRSAIRSFSGSEPPPPKGPKTGGRKTGGPLKQEVQIFAFRLPATN